MINITATQFKKRTYYLSFWFFLFRLTVLLVHYFFQLFLIPIIHSI
ncbi:hypothetical protein H8958_021439 [Nasalis larvatus]|uniref:PRO2710 n=2 Tax=Catarrhini TaxID=9526 RepID=Q9P155_HUMAN|nr:PRO2710 [Homo sapiens]